MLFAGIVSHLLLFICLVKDPLQCFRNSATYLIANLALSDFITCVLSLITLCYADVVPHVFSAMKTAMLASLLSIFSIAIDRYVLTVHPFKHRVFLNGRRIALWIVLIWLLSFSLLAKSLAFGGNKNYDLIVLDWVFIVISLVTGFIYVLTYFSLKKQGRNISEGNRSQSRAFQEKFLKTIMIVAFIQVFTLAPSSVYGLIRGWSGGFSIAGYLVFAMYFLNFSINPFVYIWRLRNYRQTFRLIFRRI
jgi:hypothetical protein